MLGHKGNEKCKIVIVGETNTYLVDATPWSAPGRHKPSTHRVVEFFCGKVFEGFKHVHPTIDIAKSFKGRILLTISNDKLPKLNHSVPNGFPDPRYDGLLCKREAPKSPVRHPWFDKEKEIAGYRKEFTRFVLSDQFVCPAGKAVIASPNGVHFNPYGQKGDKDGISDAEVLRLHANLVLWTHEQEKINRDERRYLTSFIAYFPFASARGKPIESDEQAHPFFKSLLFRLHLIDRDRYPWHPYAKVYKDGKTDGGVFRPSGVSLGGDAWVPMAGHPNAQSPTHRFPLKGLTVAFNSVRAVLWAEASGALPAIVAMVTGLQAPYEDRIVGKIEELCLSTMAVKPANAPKDWCNHPPYLESKVGCN